MSAFRDGGHVREMRFCDRRKFMSKANKLMASSTQVPPESHDLKDSPVRGKEEEKGLPGPPDPTPPKVLVLDYNC